MGLKIKKFQDIFDSFVTWITADNSKLSDFNVGSALRTLSESIALQMEELYFNMKQNVEYAIETAIYSSFGFEAVKETTATGYIKLIMTEPLESPKLLPTGFTVCTSMSNSKVVYYQTTDEYLIDENATEAIIKVQCTEPGEIGNCEIGEIDTIITLYPWIDSISNETRFIDGTDAESKSDMKERFKEYLKSLGRATRESIAYGAKTVDGVSGVYVDDNYIGFVNVYCHDKNGDLPDELKGRIEVTLEDYRAAGIEVKVLPVIKHTIDIDDLIVVIKDDIEIGSVIDSINLLITSYLNSYTVSKDFYVSDIITLIMNNYGNLVVTIDIGNLSNIRILDNELVVAGNIDVKFARIADWR